ncbi:MAG: protein arginine kinase [Candidatus Krumholzibacteria bacterium]|nr:protein arginine kinase [Candidatus Krumholzibacteria bacterium]
MQIRDMVKKPAKWLDAAGDEKEIVLSSRIRMARNIEDRRFPQNAEKEELAAVLEQTRSAADKTSALGTCHYFPMGNVSSLDRQFLAERHLVSREFLFNSSNRGLIVNAGEDLCVMINEEDHLRIQSFGAGFNLRQAYDRADRVDSELSRQLGFAFTDRLGHLTACPTNLGTGLRASLLIHLPGLVHSKEINKLLDSLRQLHHSIRGLYGEGTEVMGNFFQLSNNVTLGLSEDVIVSNLKEMVLKVIGFERRAREMLFRKARSLLEDKVWRAYGLLCHSRSVSTKEALSLISAVRLGVGMGIVKNLSLKTLNELLVYIQPAHLQMREGRSMDAHQRDVARADYLRHKLSGDMHQEEE